MSKLTEFYIGTLSLLVPDNLTDAEYDALCEAVYADVEMGLQAVGRNVVEKHGHLTTMQFKVEV